MDQENEPSKDKYLKSLYEDAENRTGETVANVFKAQSLTPEILREHMRFYETTMFGKGELPIAFREMIGVVVSKANECPYCVSHHTRALLKVTTDKKRLAQIGEDFRRVELSKAEEAICLYAEKLTKSSFKMTEKDIDSLRVAGLNDQAIVEVNQVAAYYNYVNRIVDGLGVELEATMHE